MQLFAELLAPLLALPLAAAGVRALVERAVRLVLTLVKAVLAIGAALALVGLLTIGHLLSSAGSHHPAPATAPARTPAATSPAKPNAG